jgi:uncharacterized protein YjeT (DUF2065 family)
MTGLAAITILLGVLAILSRGPLVFAPDATLGVYRKLLESNARVRIMGCCLAALGVAMVVLAQGSELTAVRIIGFLGWYMVCVAALFLLLFPAAYRRFALSMLEATSQAVRPLGAMGVGVGVLIIWLGLSVL